MSPVSSFSTRRGQWFTPCPSERRAGRPTRAAVIVNAGPVDARPLCRYNALMSTWSGSLQPHVPARLTPYELVFARAGFEEEHFPMILAEAKERGVETSDPDRFLFLTAVGKLLRAMLPEDAGEPAVRRYGMFFFQAFNFWRFGRRLYLLEPAAARHLLDGAPPVGEWELIPPHPAGYLQLPRHLFWARVEENAVPEPVDGFFWTMVGEEDPAQPPYSRLDSVLALGVRPGRAGLSVIEVGATLGGGPGHWADADARPEGRDFANVLPGGELEGLYAITNEAEVLKLISLIFWYTAVHPDAVGEPERGMDPKALETPDVSESQHGEPESASPGGEQRRGEPEPAHKGGDPQQGESESVRQLGRAGEAEPKRPSYRLPPSALAVRRIRYI